MNMYADIEKIVKVINSCITSRHFDVAERMIVNFGRSWKLAAKADSAPNPVFAGLWAEVDRRREEVIYDGTETSQ